MHVNDDPHLDLCIGQNFYTPQRETGRMAGGVGVVLLGDGQGGFAPAWPTQSGLVVPGDAKGLAYTRSPASGEVLLLVAQNNDQLLCFTLPASADHVLTARLTGAVPGGVTVGARVTAVYEDGTTAIAETRIGGGYLSQSTPGVMFGQGDARIVRLEVAWPDGKTSGHDIGASTGGAVQLTHPDHPSP